MSDNGATQFCTHTTDGTICDQCKGPWLRWDLNVHGIMCPFQRGEYYLAAPVEAAMREVKEWFKKFTERNSVLEHADGTWKCCQCEQEAEPNGDFEHYSDCEIVSAQRLLANWPIKETR